MICLNEGWEGWENEKPAWFTEDWKKKIPDDMSPDRLRLLLLGGGEEDDEDGGRPRRVTV